MRKLCLVLLSSLFILLSACQSSNEIKPIKEETIDFDINIAYEMIKKKEEMIVDVALIESITNEKYMELEETFKAEFGDRNYHFLSIFFTQNLDAAPESEKYTPAKTLYPTVFHEGIMITNAVIHKTYFEEQFFNRTMLTIKQEYNGTDEKLKDWNREYIFTLNDNGEWELYGFSGVMNFTGDDFSMHYLELKKD